MNPTATAADKRIKDNMSRLQKNGGWQAEQRSKMSAAGDNLAGKEG
jgi:hypothetical protein